jgi:hypothetical protein
VRRPNPLLNLRYLIERFQGCWIIPYFLRIAFSSQNMQPEGLPDRMRSLILPP